MGLLGTDAFDWAGSMVQNRRPEVTFGETLSNSFYQGARHSLLYETWIDRRQRNAFVAARLEADPREGEMLSPEQIAVEFPRIIKPMRNPQTRAYARYLEDRDVREMEIMDAFQGRDAGDLPDLVARFTGGIGGAILDPLNVALAIVPYAGGFGFARRAMIGARIAGKSGMSRGILGAATAADAAISESIYATLHASSRHFLLDRQYGWDELACRVA